MDVELKVEDGLATLRLERAHGNAINHTLVDALTTACQQAEADPGIRGAMLAAGGKLFSPGLDLQELIELDRVDLARFVARFGACVLSLYTFPKPLLAAIHGHAVAGGAVLALTADWRVLREGAMIGLNELRVGVPLPFGVATILRGVVPGTRLDEVVLLGRNYRGADAVAAGLVHEVQDDATFESACRERLSELADREPHAYAITKRYLRSSTVERIRSHDSQFIREFVDAWFAPETQRRIRAIVEQLRR